MEERKVQEAGRKHDRQAEKFGFESTPSFAIEGPNSEGLELLGSSGSAGEIEAAIEKAS